MAIRSFSFTLNASEPKWPVRDGQARNFAISVRRNTGNAKVVITCTVFSPFTGEILQSISFVENGSGALHMPVKYMQAMPAELLAMWQSILPRLAEFVHQMGSVLDQQHKKGS